MSWQEFFKEYSVTLTVVSVATFVAGLVAMRFAVIYMPADYFVRQGHDDGWWFDQHPAVRGTLLGLKNLLGATFLAIGLIMLLVPGPGVMMLLLGLWLVDVPGKRRLERWLVSFPTVHNKINSLRAQHNRPPLKLP